MKPIKITIGLPTNRGLRPKMAQSVLDLVAYSSKKYDLHIVVAEEGYTISENRNYLSVQALNNNSDFLFMMDDDMICPPDTIEKLVADDKDIIGIAYHPRSETGQIVKFLDETHVVKLEHNEDPKYKKVFECMATGTGIILIKAEVLKATPRPWFAFEYFPTGQCSLGEDWYFCREAKKAGFKVWCNPLIDIGHIGEKIF